MTFEIDTNGATFGNVTVSFLAYTDATSITGHPGFFGALLFNNGTLKTDMSANTTLPAATSTASWTAYNLKWPASP